MLEKIIALLRDNFATIAIIIAALVLLALGKRKPHRSSESVSDIPTKKNADSKGKRSRGKRKGKLQTIQSTQDLSPLIDIKDGIIITKDGRYYKLLEFTPINFGLLSYDEQDSIIYQFASVIRIFPPIVHIKIISAKTDLAPFLDALSARKQKELSENNAACAALIEDQIQLLKELSDTSTGTKRFFLILQYQGESGFKRTPPFEDIAFTLNNDARQISAALEGCGNLLISQNSRDYILSVFYRIMSKGASDAYSYEERKEDIIAKYFAANRGIEIPVESIPINDFITPLSIDSSLSPRYVVIDEKYITYAFIPSDDYPNQCVGGWLEQIYDYMEDVDIDFWIKKEDAESVKRKLSFELKSNKVKSSTTSDTSQDYDDLLSSIQSGYYLKEQLANGDEFCYMSIMLTIYADSLEELKAKYDILQNFLIRRDLNIRRLTFQQETAYKMSLPVIDYDAHIFRKSKRNVMASQLGAAYPFTAYELHDEGGIFLGINDDHGSPVFLNTFDTKRYQNANMMILGPSGSGKTFALMSILLRMRQRGLQVFVIAPFKGFEFYRACNAIGGEIIRIAPGSSQNINIMEIRRRDASDSEIIDGITSEQSGSIVTDKIQQMVRFFGLLIPDMTSVEKQILDDCLIKTYERFGISTKSNKSLIDPRKPNGDYKPMPVLGDLLTTLKEYDKQNSGDYALRLRKALEIFVTGSARSFNTPTNVNLNNKYVILDVSDLTAEMLPIGMFIALDFVLDKAKQSRTSRKVIAIDEMWRLMKASKLSAEFVIEVFKIIRGYAGAAIGATQDLDDVLANEYGAAIINNAKIKLLLPMDKKEADAAAEVIDLTSEELTRLKRTSLTNDGGGRRALLVANNNRVFVRIRASQQEFNLITTDASELQKQKNKMQKG